MQLSNRFLPQQPLLIVVVLLLGVSSLCLGQYPLSLSEVFYHLTHYSEAEGIASQVIWTVRLPRILMALLAGGALGLCGATLQGVFHNPLVDPHIIGVTSGAAFGGTLAILLGLSPLLMMGSTFFFGLTALILVYAIAALQGLENTLVLILSGIILSGFFAALVSLIQYQADTEETLPNIVFWLLGSFATANWHKVLLLAVPVGIAATVLFQLRWRINLLSLNDKDARALGWRWFLCDAAFWCAAHFWSPLRWRSAAVLPGLGWLFRIWRVCWWALIIVVYCRVPSGWGAVL